MARRSLFLAACGCFFLSSCNTATFQEEFGTGLGAVLGAGVGSALCDDHPDEELCILAGALVGAYLGNRIGKRLGEEEKKEAFTCH